MSGFYAFMAILSAGVYSIICFLLYLISKKYCSIRDIISVSFILYLINIVIFFVSDSEYSLCFFMSIILGAFTANIAAKKGRNFIKWWIYGYLIFFVAFIHAISLSTDTEQLLKNNDSLYKKCPYCAEIIKKKLLYVNIVEKIYHKKKYKKKTHLKLQIKMNHQILLRI